MHDIIIGIDLGTTNSEVAIIENGRLTILDAEHEQKILPSVVGLDPDQKLLVGTPAKNQYVLHPQRTIKSVKRQMGEDIQLTLGEQYYTPQEISAMILSQLKQTAEAHLGQPVNKAVITVPAYFSDSQRQATRDAGQIAGLEVVRIINEPTAAAMAYQTDDDKDKKVLVYDLGGGTFDVSVVSLAQGVVEVLASHGNSHLGGDDFDREIVTVIKQQLQQQSVDISDDPLAQARIEKAAEQAKIALSSQPFVRIEEQFITSDEHLSFEFSREHYQQLIDPYINETLDSIHTALDGAQITSSDIDEVILVGGSSRTPLVRERLKAIFAMVPRGDIDPDLCVAAGAAIVAANCAGHSTDKSITSVLVDITPYTFGSSAMDELDGLPYQHCFIPQIDKYTPLPVSRSEVFYTLQPGQPQVNINIFQGDDPDALRNIKIGEFTIHGLDKNAIKNTPIILTLNIDINGILKVTAMEKNTGLSKSITIDNAISRFENEQVEAAKQRVQSLFDLSADDREAASEADGSGDNPGGERLRQQFAQASALIEQAGEWLESVDGDDKQDLIEMCAALQQALDCRDGNALAEASESLTDLLYFLAS